jgi:hypothetical protein
MIQRKIIAGKSEAVMALLRLCFLKICKSAPNYYTLQKIKRLCLPRILICNQFSASF